MWLRAPRIPPGSVRAADCDSGAGNPGRGLQAGRGAEAARARGRVSGGEQGALVRVHLAGRGRTAGAAAAREAGSGDARRLRAKTRCAGKCGAPRRGPRSGTRASTPSPQPTLLPGILSPRHRARFRLRGGSRVLAPASAAQVPPATEAPWSASARALPRASGPCFAVFEGLLQLLFFFFQASFYKEIPKRKFCKTGMLANCIRYKMLLNGSPFKRTQTHWH